MVETHTINQKRYLAGVHQGKFDHRGCESVIRFPEASSEKHFAEYYLIGTLTSFTIALATGLVARYVISNQRYFFW